MQKFFLALIIASSAQATIIDVNLGDNLQMAADTSQSGDTLLLQRGDHSTSLILRLHSLTIASSFVLDGDTSHISQTRLLPSDELLDTASCVIVHNLPTDTIRFIGVTVAEGIGTLDIGNQIVGGGILARQSHIVLNNCGIKNCSGESGGGIYIYGFPSWNPIASLTMVDCVIDSCTCGAWGGGVYANRVSVSLENCQFSGNQSFQDGGGLITLDCIAELDRCMFAGNAGTTGGAYLAGRRQVVRNCVFVNNSSDQFTYWAAHLSVNLGYFIVEGCYFGETDSPARSVNTCCDWRDTVVFRGNVLENNEDTALLRTRNFSSCGIMGEVSNCIFRNNVSGGSQIYVFCGSSVRIFENLFSENRSTSPLRPSVIRTGTQGRPEIFNNLIVGNFGQTIDYFVDYPATIDARQNWWGHETGPYHPTQNPFGQGDTILSDSVLFDPWLLSPPDTSTSVTHPRPETPANWKLMNVYPNPFNSELTISLAGIMGSDFSLKLYDTLGRVVAILHEGRGHGQMIHYSAPPSLATGVYFLQASEGPARNIKKVVFLK